MHDLVADNIDLFLERFGALDGAFVRAIRLAYDQPSGKSLEVELLAYDQEANSANNQVTNNVVLRLFFGGRLHYSFENRPREESFLINYDVSIFLGTEPGEILIDFDPLHTVPVDWNEKPISRNYVCSSRISWEVVGLGGSD